MNDIKNDINLKEAVSRREQQLPPMPEGLNEKVIKSLPRPLPRRGERTEGVSSLSLWRGRGVRLFALAACVAGFVVIFLASPKSTEEQQPLALEEPVVNSQEPIVGSQLSTPLKGRLGSLELPLNVATAPQRGANPHSRRRARMEGASQQPAVVKPKRTPKRKRVVPQEPQEEPLLAEAETVEEFPTEAAYQEFLDKMRKPSTSSYATQTQEIRERGEQVTQYVAMLNQQIKTEQQYVEY